ncbi:hypothetical protein IE077_003026 [Cardiosporidium cionae]|uniref:Leucyl/phenylalanyl-tRNA--protein transferase n=1 Tax=Cardiosporidium cionae TaxID=476202 RepID=A0ABQ7J9F3_9APIC|nr:hypothetical protein IE077_003026 [Cardiosporidium cionae]|eukprot:KAF8820579.1 hypothetical protein IE077_003026 [Cardiosporidium cionae]
MDPLQRKIDVFNGCAVVPQCLQNAFHLNLQHATCSWRCLGTLKFGHAFLHIRTGVASLKGQSMDIFTQISIYISASSIPQLSKTNSQPGDNDIFSAIFHSDKSPNCEDNELDSNQSLQQDYYHFLKRLDMGLYKKVKQFTGIKKELCHLPLVSPLHSLDKMADIIAFYEFPSDFTWSPCVSSPFIERLLYAGFIPLCERMRMEGEPTYFLLPKLHQNRCTMRFQNLHVSKNCKKRSKRFLLSIDTAFNEVLDSCVLQHGENWLHPPLREAFLKLFEGNAVNKIQMHSIEAWTENGNLTAGEIGVTVGHCYCSLTGFFRESSSGSIQLCALGKLLSLLGYKLWDLGMYIEYKSKLGSGITERKTFLKDFRQIRDLVGQ